MNTAQQSVSLAITGQFKIPKLGLRYFFRGAYNKGKENRS